MIEKTENAARIEAPDDEKAPEKPEKSPLRETIEYILYLVCVVIGCLLFIRFVAVRSVVDGHSMNDTLHDKDNLIVEKITYYIREPARYDVVVFRLKNDRKTHYIKRIIGLPGETVQIIEGYVYINGEKLEDDIYCKDLIEYGYTADQPITLGEDEYFCMGDNRNHSKDSRSVDVGPIKRSQFVGRAWIRFWPLTKIGKIE